MSTELQEILIVTTLIVVMLAVNIKTGTQHWTGSLLKWLTYLLLIAGLATLSWLTFVSVFR